MTAVSVVGMHRSGTSCLTGSLEAAGFFCGEVVRSAPFNLKGNREHLGIRALNDDVLAFSGGAWDAPPESLRWTPGLAERRDALVAEFEAQGRAWLFKDPRTLLTLPFWRERLPGLVTIGIFRAPLAVAGSLAHRNRFACSKSVRLWCAYNQRLLEAHEGHSRPLLCFDLPEADFLASVESTVRWLASFLGVPAMDATGSRGFYERGLVHQPSVPSLEAVGTGLRMALPDDEALAGEAASLYGSLLDSQGIPA